MIAVALFLFSVVYFNTAARAAQTDPSVSGRIDSGFRILPIAPTPDKVHLTVYRGDYVKFDFNGAINDPVLSIPALSIEQKLPKPLSDAPHFKMKQTGTFDFSLGAVHGDITVIDYRRPNYREVTAKQAAELIQNIQPLILDVRTSGEFKKGHIQHAKLIPVQELQSRLKELSAYKNQDILIYCATGNRSTVASKILIDHGFQRIFNMRHGIYGWYQDKYPIVTGG